MQASQLQATEKTEGHPSLEHDDDSHRFLIFRLGNELYGCRLVQIKEVIKVANIKTVPYMVPYFKGVINLRGKIIGVVDLPQKLSLKSNTSQQLILITETREGSLGVIVDEVLAVEVFENKDIDRNVAVETKIAPKFFDGIGRKDKKLFHLINIGELFSDEELRQFKG